MVYNEHGYRIGETHQNSTISDDDVRLINLMIEDADQCRAAGKPYVTDCEIAQKFEIAKSTVHAIRHGLRRCQIPTTYRRVKIKVL